jgi:hypothetical protein
MKIKLRWAPNPEPYPCMLCLEFVMATSPGVMPLLAIDGEPHRPLCLKCAKSWKRLPAEIARIRAHVTWVEELLRGPRPEFPSRDDFQEVRDVNEILGPVRR